MVKLRERGVYRFGDRSRSRLKGARVVACGWCGGYLLFSPEEWDQHAPPNLELGPDGQIVLAGKPLEDTAEQLVDTGETVV